MEFKVLTYSGSIQDCDCCGTYSGQGVFVLSDNKLIWERYSDGHMYGRQTEDSILESMLSYMEEVKLEEIEAEHTEDARVLWNKKYPGNGIARTKESWMERKNELVGYVKENISQIRENSKILPYNEVLQVKMILLWAEEVFGDKFSIVEDFISEEELEELNLEV